ncbi:FAD-binding oxidoreductase [Candidatus Saccharibacteria bacterium]|nr:MAG: FAD-binding oxidoreductase [Candidatus Saccharibacteria bacterium]
MKDLKEKLQRDGFSGELDDSLSTKMLYSHDASMFELVPQLVVQPKHSADVQRLVRFVRAHKKQHPDLSLTARAAGTDMAGGAIGESIVVDFSKHFTKIGAISGLCGTAQSGVLYRDFERETLKKGVLMPSYPASRDMCQLGGIVANNAGGEKSLEYGKVESFVQDMKVVFADGNEYTVKPLSAKQLQAKIKKRNFEGKLYKRIYELCEEHYDLIKEARPKVSKNSMGYGLWNVWDRDTGVFDLGQLIVGSGGTLGLITETTFRLVPYRPHSGLLVLFLRDIDALGELIPKVLQHKPAALEGFDDQTLALSLRCMPTFYQKLGLKKFARLLWSLAPDCLRFVRRKPKLVLMIEFSGESEEEVREKVRALHRELKDYRARYEINGFEEDPTEGKSEKFWLIRRYSFQIVRTAVKEKQAAPYIDDFVVPPKHLVRFLPELQQILRKYNLFATIAGHLGDGNFHVIPLMKVEDDHEREKIVPSQREINNLVLKYEGSLSGEHNDGLVRGPWLEAQFGKAVFGLFTEVKHIFDPENIFNPHKKTDSDWHYTFSHIREHF